jgi:membrane protein implicated in regulation of membrane protease activity
MDQIARYFEWHYLPFLIPFLLSLIMILVSQLGGFDHDHGTAGHGHGIHHDAHHSVHHSAHHGAHHDAHHDGGRSPADAFWNGLTFLGVGRVPLTTLLFSAGLMWGLIGFTANMLLQGILAPPMLAFLAAFGIALFGTVLFTHLTGRIVSRIIPPEGPGARTEVSLLGEIGTAQSSITTESGTVLLRSGGDTYRVSCRIHSGEAEIQPGERVQLVAYEPTGNLFFAHVIPPEQTPKQKIELLERR